MRIKAYIPMFVICLIFITATAHGKLKTVKEPAGDYDFKAVEKIVVLPITSDNVDFGKVDEDRMPKIQALLEKTKTNLRDHMVKGSKNAKTTIPFYYKAPNKKKTTLLMKYNIDQFDNGSQAKRLIPFAGKAKVALSVKFIDAKDNTVLAEVKAEAKEKGGMVPGGFDSEVLWRAVNMANADVYKFLKKQTGLDYSFFSGLGENVKMGTKTQADMLKEEGKEKDVAEKKQSKSRRRK